MACSASSAAPPICARSITPRRSVDVHPRLVPEAVKLAIVRLLKDGAEGGEPAPPAYRAAAEIVGYCMIVAKPSRPPMAPSLRPEVEGRIERALIAGSKLDARLVLLTLHAGVCQPSVIARFESKAGKAEVRLRCA